MIRDPSDGSVREIRENPVLEENRLRDQPHVSGLPLESTKAERQARLEKSRAWLKDYFKRNPEQGT